MRGESLPAIRVVFLESRCVQLFSVREFGFVWETEFLHDDDHLPGIGALNMTPDSDFFGHGVGYGVFSYGFGMIVYM